MATLQSPLPLPRSLQELILAKLPLQDLLRSRAVCKLWRRLSTTKNFRKRYECQATEPWLLMLKLPEFIATTDLTGKKVPLPSSRLYADSQVLSTSAGLILLMYKTGRFAVLNPITLDVKHLPPLDVKAERENIVYSGIFCPDPFSYKVVVIGLMEADKLTGHLYSVNFGFQPGFVPAIDLPKDFSEYMQPFMRVYNSSSNSEEWTSITDFPPGFLLPFRMRSESHQSFISKGVLYCTVNTDNEMLNAGKIARFDMAKLQWNRRLVALPEKLTLTNYIADEGGEVVVVMADRENWSFMAASIERDKLVLIKSRERLFPEMIHPTRLSFEMLQVFGVFGKVVCIHVPLEVDGVDLLASWDGSTDTVKSLGDDIEKEPQMLSFLLDMKESRLHALNEIFILPLGMVVSEMVCYLKLAFYPSLRLP